LGKSEALRFLVIGSNGQVGWELCRTLSSLGEVVAIDRPDVELSSADSIRAVIRDKQPKVIINAAAYTAVDKAEEEPELAMQINAFAPAVMADEARRLSALFVTYSTDYVFDGSKTGSYAEDDQPNPLSVYGKTKLAGDDAVKDSGASYLIFRTSWVYGARGKNFLLTMKRLATERKEIKVVDDQVGAPTWSRSIAEATAQIIAQRMSPELHGSRSAAETFAEITGLYNLTCTGETSWCGFAAKIADQVRASREGSVARILPIKTDEYPVRARRPMNSILNNTKLKRTFGLQLPVWDAALNLVMDELRGSQQALPAGIEVTR